MKKNLSLFLFSLIISILLLEIIIRIVFPQSLQKYWIYHEPSYGLNINKKNYIHEIHRVQSNIAKYKFGEYHNRIINKKFKFNQDNKVLILGDSFAFGWLLNDQDTFIHKLQKDNLNYNFINVSVAAWGSSNYTLFADLFCKDIKPKKIFVFLNTDDFHRGYKSKYYSYKDNVLIKTKVDYVDNQKDSKFDKKIPFYKLLKSKSHLFMFVRNSVHKIIHEPFTVPWTREFYWARPPGEFKKDYSNKVKKYNEKIFLKLREISNNCNSSLYLFNLLWADYTMMRDTNPNKLFLQSAKNFFTENNFNYYEDKSKMEKLYIDPMKYIIDIDFHPNKKGSNLIYENLKKEIKRVLSN